MGFFDYFKLAFRFIWHLPRLVLCFIIRIYQKTLSPDHSVMFKSLFPHGYCKFSPSCSEYAKRALMKKGVVLGIPLAIWRVLRCNPFSKGGEDEI